MGYVKLSCWRCVVIVLLIATMDANRPGVVATQAIGNDNAFMCCVVHLLYPIKRCDHGGQSLMIPRD